MSGSVLLYEDDQGILGCVSELLVDEGYRVTVCDSLAELQAQSSLDPTALALVDAWGPSYNVLAACDRQEIRALAVQVPTVMLTARSWFHGVSAIELGLLALLSKPIDLDALAETVGQHVARLRAEHQVSRGRSQ